MQMLASSVLLSVMFETNEIQSSTFSRDALIEVQPVYLPRRVAAHIGE